MTNKRAAMEMSIGTIVVIVLAMTMLILGIFLVQKIFSSATTSIDSIDQEIKNEISKLFSADDSKKIVIYPPSRKIEIKKGEQGSGFAFSIRNVYDEADTFSYTIEAMETDSSSLSVEEADSYIGLGKEGEVQISASSIMENPKLVTFNIPDTAPACSVSYSITLTKDGTIYGSSVDVILNIKAK